MAEQNRGLGDALRFCKDFVSIKEEMQGKVDSIKSINNSARSVLRDDIGSKCTDRLEDFCRKMTEILNDGEERIRVLEKKYQAQLDEAEQLRGRCR